jgi:hypothetical protein
MDIDRNRRYARLKALASKPDEALDLWFWYSAARFELYLYAVRYIQHENLIRSKTTANLHLHNVMEIQ